MGYTKVRHYAGGLATWIQEGGPVEGRASGLAGKLIALPSPARSSEPAGESGDGAAGDEGSGAAGLLAPAGHGGPSESVLPRADPALSRPQAVRRNGSSARILDFLSSVSFGKLLGSWLFLVLACGIAYWALSTGFGPSLIEHEIPVPATWSGLLTAVYFSFVTATSVGFGDVVPVGPARILSILEAAAGLLLFGCVISKIVTRRQDQLIEETHRNAFEARLARVRINLHLVLAEFQTIASEWSEQRLPAERILPRVESAAMVFGGELRTIHDLLYRPQQAPDAPVLETILASLAAAMRELCELLEELGEVRYRSAILGSGVTAMSRLAGEICGECVPREYAPELKIWMDRIQQLAGKLAPAGR